ncbi:hypothetical protein CAPTEDRAFT_192407 [Capitella teleta]|uniref:VWFA domain-containing protein n=1 Tax=Capitella teleta TaxID=283909 RepID=R7VDQ4_CAPTE|nr:hypothetical protein CAPTEDRAFT_192407 [Capitella teleta]|eukprot:ELU16667.1 hypothetical protein CAPTEDRAFT_192407 [Capitella teleta]
MLFKHVQHDSVQSLLFNDSHCMFIWFVSPQDSGTARINIGRDDEKEIIASHKTQGCMMMPCHNALLLLAMFLASSSSSDEPESVLTGILENFVNERLGVQKMQDHLDRSIFDTSPVVPQHLLNTLAESLSKKFSERVAVAKRLRDKVEQVWGSLPRTTSIQKCCSNVNAKEIGSNFQQQVDREQACNHGPGINTNSSKYPNKSIVDVMKENLYQYPSIKFQYVGTEEGVTTVFPKFKICSSTYDPRFRPWYVEAATPEPKDVVVVIDVSGSMNATYKGTKLMKIAQEAANTVITTLNPNDRSARILTNFYLFINITYITRGMLSKMSFTKTQIIGVVSFSDKAYSATGSANQIKCRKTELALATPHNKKYLKSLINGLYAEGETYYKAALSLAFDFFSKGNAREKVILFLTDGQPTDERTIVLSMISQRNAVLGNSVAILTYGLGELVDDEILTKIAQQSSYNASAGEIKEGVYTRVSNPSNLRFEMASFYNFFGISGRLTNPIFTVPYFDAFGLGLISSVCMPFYYQSNLKGVTCVDISMSDLLSDVAFFGRTDSSYAFIIDSVGRLLMHPLLPSPQSITDDPIFLQVTSLETSPPVEQVLKSMLAGESGKRLFKSLRVVSRGDSILEGSRYSNVKSVYSWKQIMPNNFSLCVVTVESDIETTLSVKSNQYQTFLYHRLDLEKDSDKCEYFGATATTAESAVLLSPIAFEKPYLQIIRKETVQDVKQYKSHFENGVSSSKFKEFVYDYVVLSAYLDELVLDQAHELLDSAVWAYVGFNVGVFRLYPGTRLNQEYDATKRPWYKRALAQKGRIAFSIPYEDAFGAGAVITMSKTILASRSGGHVNTDPVVGAMGLDFKMDAFYVFLTDAFPACLDSSNVGCFIIDDAGFVIMHHDWLNLKNRQDAYNIHISQKEPGVARTLIENKVMIQTGCINHEQLLHQYTWLVSMQNTTLSFRNFVIYNIRETNLFVVVLRSRSEETSDCHMTSLQSGFSMFVGWPSVLEYHVFPVSQCGIWFIFCCDFECDTDCNGCPHFDFIISIFGGIASY